MGVTFIAKEGTYTAPAKLTTKSITENGTYSAVDDSANGFSSVAVNVPLPTGKITITENGTDINIAQYAKADVNVAGGSSDFSTAEVTFVSISDSYMARVTCVEDDCIKTVDSAVSSQNTVTFIVPLYKGKTILPISCISGNDESYMPTTEGSIVFDLDSFGYIVTGNGSITAKGRSIG